jgi:hypothetical protein
LDVVNVGTIFQQELYVALVLLVVGQSMAPTYVLVPVKVGTIFQHEL